MRKCEFKFVLIQHLCTLACNSRMCSSSNQFNRESVRVSPGLLSGSPVPKDQHWRWGRGGGSSLWVKWCENGGPKEYGTRSRDWDSTCRGVTKIKVPLIPVGPMGHVAPYPSAPASPPLPPCSQASKQLSIPTEKQVGSSVCVCACVCMFFEPALQLGSYGCWYNKNKEILPLF